MNQELLDVQVGFKETEEPEIKLPTFVESYRKQRSSTKTSSSASLTILKPFTVWITKKCGKFLNRFIPDHLRNLYLVKKQQLEPNIELTGPKLGKG